MRLRYSIRFLLSATAAFGLFAMGLRLWMNQTALEDVAAELNHLKSLSLYDFQDITSDCVPDLSEMRFLDWLNVLSTTVENDSTIDQDPPAMLVEWEM